MQLESVKRIEIVIKKKHLRIKIGGNAVRVC